MRKRQDGERTRQNILTMAEQLFADHGYEGVSLRKITSECGVELSSVNYHFKSKEQLFHSVVIMRAEEMNKKRVVSLNEVIFSGDTYGYIASLLDAFCDPFTTEKTNDNLIYYRRLVAWLLNSRRWQIKLFQQHTDPIVSLLIEKINEQLTFKNKEDLYWYISFFLGALANAFAETGRIDRLSDGLCNSSDLETVKNKLIEFTASGICHNAVKK